MNLSIKYCQNQYGLFMYATDIYCCLETIRNTSLRQIAPLPDILFN